MYSERTCQVAPESTMRHSGSHDLHLVASSLGPCASFCDWPYAFVNKVHTFYARMADLRLGDFLKWSVNMARWRVGQASVELVEVDREADQQWHRRKEGRLVQVLLDVQ